MGHIESIACFLKPTNCLLHCQVAGVYSYMIPYIISSIFTFGLQSLLYTLWPLKKNFFLTSVLEVTPPGFAYAVPSA